MLLIRELTLYQELSGIPLHEDLLRSQVRSLPKNFWQRRVGLARFTEFPILDAVD